MWAQQLWEDVMRYGGTKEKVVAFMDVRAGFDLVPHSQPLRKLELISYDSKALKWLSLTGRSQYVVMEATDGRSRREKTKPPKTEAGQ